MTYTDSRGTPLRLDWVSLGVVEIVTTNEGPFAEDVFWVLHGHRVVLSIPQTAEGSDDLLARLQTLPGFDNSAVITAMSSVANERFRCWERGKL